MRSTPNQEGYLSHKQDGTGSGPQPHANRRLPGLSLRGTANQTRNIHQRSAEEHTECPRKQPNRIYPPPGYGTFTIEPMVMVDDSGAEKRRPLNCKERYVACPAVTHISACPPETFQRNRGLPADAPVCLNHSPAGSVVRSVQRWRSTHALKRNSHSLGERPPAMAARPETVACAVCCPTLRNSCARMKTPNPPAALNVPQTGARNAKPTATQWFASPHTTAEPDSRTEERRNRTTSRRNVKAARKVLRSRRPAQRSGSSNRRRRCSAAANPPPSFSGGRRVQPGM